jgi:hypothetical protein
MSWHDVVTLDGSWFYYITDNEFMWLPLGGKVPNGERGLSQRMQIQRGAMT